MELMVTVFAAPTVAESATPGIRPQLQLPAPDQLPVVVFQVQLAAMPGWENATSARVTAVASGLTALEGDWDMARAECWRTDLAVRGWWQWWRFMIVLRLERGGRVWAYPGFRFCSFLVRGYQPSYRCDATGFAKQLACQKTAFPGSPI
jgi:hypothetical protein